MSKKKKPEEHKPSRRAEPIDPSRPGRRRSKPEGLAHSFDDFCSSTLFWIRSFNEVSFAPSEPIRQPTDAEKYPNFPEWYDDAADLLKKVEQFAKAGKAMLKEGKDAAEKRIKQVQERAIHGGKSPDQSQEEKKQEPKAATRPAADINECFPD